MTVQRHISPAPTPEEAAAIAAALASRTGPDAGDPGNLKRQRWRLAGLEMHAASGRSGFGGSHRSRSGWGRAV